MARFKSVSLLILFISFEIGAFEGTKVLNEVNSKDIDENLNLQSDDQKTLDEILQIFEKKFQIQNEKLTEMNENIMKMQQQQLLNNQLTTKDIQTGLQNYDEHFNCLNNCTTKTRGPVLTSCHDATQNYDNRDGIYLIKIPNSSLGTFYVYCAYEGPYYSKAWTIIQRRTDGSENFFRNWYDYKYGFGNLYNEYWIGLERLHEMTKNRKHELWILLENFNNEKRYAKYADFSISDEQNNYKLNVFGFNGDAGDALAYSNRQPFSTYDNNNSKIGKTNCGVQEKSGWWHMLCTEANLNGPYFSSANRKTFFGIYWTNFGDSLKYVHMAIRPAN